MMADPPPLGKNTGSQHSVCNTSAPASSNSLSAISRLVEPLLYNGTATLIALIPSRLLNALLQCEVTHTGCFDNLTQLAPRDRQRKAKKKKGGENG